ncbi:MAG: flagellar motor protein [Acetobacterium woodii]|nr:flagellar motor protein [Acetobacterium woodii]
MDIFVIIFSIGGLTSIIVAFWLEGGAPLHLLSPTAFMIVILGTIGATGMSFPMSEIKKIPKFFKVAFTNKKYDYPGLIENMKAMSKTARTKGILSLEKEVLENNEIDAFTKRGLQFILDGLDPVKTREALESDLEMIEHRHHGGAAIFEAAGGFAPTLGIIGTCLGLINVLGNLSEPDKLGESIAVAFICTLYGLATANLFWLPIGTNLKNKSKKEIVYNSMIIEGLILIQEGANPNFVEEKLKGYLSMKELEGGGGKSEGKPAKGKGKKGK